MTSTLGRQTYDLSAEERRAHETAILLEIAQAAGSTLDLDEVLDRVVEKAASLSGADRCSIWLLDPGQERLIPAALYGMDPAFTARWKRRILAVRDERLSQEVIVTGRPVVVVDAETDPRTDKTAVALFADKSILVVPLLSKGRVIGTMFLNHVGQPYAYSDQEVAVTMALASQAAVAIDNAQLYEESRRKGEELLASFRRVGDALVAGLDLSETLQIIVNLASEMVHAEVGCLELVGEGGELTVQATRGVRLDVCRLEVAARGDSLGETVLRERQPLRIADIHAETRVITGNPFGGSISAYLGVPLRLRGEVKGVLAVCDRHPGRFTSREMELLGSFANQAAVAIDNARLFSALQDQVAELSAAMTQNAVLYGRLQLEKDRLDAIFHNSSDAIYMVDSDLRILAFNPAAETLTGWRKDEAIGARCADVIRCNLTAGASGKGAQCSAPCPMLRVIATKESLPYVELRIVAKDGTTKDVAASHSFIPASNDTGPYGVAIVRDISPIKEVDRLKSEFVSMVSHDLRTPLAVIKGYAATLLNPMLALDQEREKRFIKGINDASDRLTRLIDNLLSVSRLESGRFKLNPQQVDVGEIVQRVAASFRSSSRHHLVVDLPAEGLRVRADRDQVEQVLTNLVSNAIKYSPEGSEIRIAGAGNPTEVEVEVRDQGIGIPPAQLLRVFEKFYRGDAAVTKRVSGTGLGLYICKSIVEAHGGRIWVESEPDHGSVFHFTLPRGFEEAES